MNLKVRAAKTPGASPGLPRRFAVWGCGRSGLTIQLRLGPTMNYSTRDAARPDPGTREGCRFCGSTSLTTSPCDPPHHAATSCRDCGRHIRYEPKPWTRGRAMEFRLPFGKYRGRTVGDILDADRPYIEWMAASVVGNARTAASLALGIEPGGRVSS